MMKFYQFKPKKGILEECPPNDFFDLWSLFCKDVKDIWKNELINIEIRLVNNLREQTDNLINYYLTFIVWS